MSDEEVYYDDLANWQAIVHVGAAVILYWGVLVREPNEGVVRARRGEETDGEGRDLGLDAQQPADEAMALRVGRAAFEASCRLALHRRPQALG